MADINQIIGQNLRRLLDERDKTQADLASFMGVSTATVSFWCTGQRVPRMDKMDKICRYLGCTRSDIMESPRLVKGGDITKDEYEMIMAFRRCDRGRQEIILELMGLSVDIEESGSA